MDVQLVGRESELKQCPVNDCVSLYTILAPSTLVLPVRKISFLVSVHSRINKKSPFKFNYLNQFSFIVADLTGIHDCC